MAVPLLVYVLGLRVQEATAISLVVVAASAGLGTYTHLRAGTVRLKAAALFSASGAVGAWIGAFGHRLVREEVILASFGLLMLAVAWRMWQPRESSTVTSPGESCAERLPRMCVIRVTGIGLLVGVVTGFLGVGGGFMIMPALSMILGFPMPVAIGTSLLITTWISLGGIVGHLQYGHMDWPVTGYLLLGSGLGMFVGTELARRVLSGHVNRVFAMIAAAIAVALILQNGLALIGWPP
jgi:hypothetical protein